MSAVRAWVLYLLVVFGGGALLAPALYGLVQWAAAGVPLLEVLAQHPFHRYVNRAMLGLALAGLWPLLGRLGLRSWSGLGWGGSAAAGRAVGGGLVLGLVSVALMAILVMLGGRRVLRVDLELVTVVYRLAGVLGTAVVVAWMEETLFRGALQGGLRGFLGNRAALGVGAVFYAVLHFLARVRWEAPVTWHSGFEVLGQMLAGLGEWPWVLPHLLNLLIAGLVLGLAFEGSGRLYLPAGLHAGWVLGIKGFAVLTREVPGVAPWVYGTSLITDGWCAMVPLLLALAALPWVCRRTKEGMQ